MGNYAASGGYYISCAANKIVAERTTLTGSIGVFGVVRNFTGTFDKVGVTTDIVKQIHSLIWGTSVVRCVKMKRR